MKHFFITILTLITAVLSVNARAITLNGDGTVTGIVAADIMAGSSGTFFDWSSPDLVNPSSQRDPAASITDDNLFNTYAFSDDIGAYVDLGFSTSIYNGTGDDLAFFVTGDPAKLDFSAVVSDDFGHSLSISSSINPYFIDWRANLDVNGTPLALSMVLIDLDDYGSDVFGTNPLTNIRFNLGGEFISPGVSQAPGLSLTGGIHTSAAVVPLPLPIVLFGSGLGLLGLFGRRKKAQR